MSGDFHNLPQSVRDKVLADAIAAGRHAEAWQTVCEGCGQWVTEIVHIVVGSRKRLGRCCAPPDPKAVTAVGSYYPMGEKGPRVWLVQRTQAHTEKRP